MGSPYGPAVVDGVPRYTSVSSLQTFDPNTYAGCERRWWFDKVGGKKEPETEAQERGKRMLHDPIEAFYETGVRAFGPLILPIVRWMPVREPAPGRRPIWCEWELSPHLLADETERKVALAHFAAGLPDVSFPHHPLDADGIPLVGKIDVSHDWGEWINLDGDVEPDPGVAFEVLDWKSTGDRKYAKTGRELASAIQMVGYAEHRFRLDPRAERGRVSHVYTLTKGRSEGWKVSTVVSREDVHRRWGYVDGLGRRMRDVAREIDPEKVPGNHRSCDAYFRGCPHREYCSVGLASKGAAQAARSASLFGAAGRARLLGSAPAEERNSLAEDLESDEPMSDILDALLDEEAQQNAVDSNGELITALKEIEARGVGRPMYTGDVAKVYASSVSEPRLDFQGDGLAGHGKLKGLAPIGTKDGVIKLRDDLRKHAEKKTPAAAPAPAPVAQPTPSASPAAMGIVSPQTPASNPALAALPAPGLEPPPAPPAPQAQAEAKSEPVTKAQAEPKSEPVTKAQAEPKSEPVTKAQLVAAGNPEPPPAAEPTKKAGVAAKKKKDEAPAPKGPAPDGDEPFELYVDCRPEGAQPLEPWISYWARGIAHHHGVPDIRTGDKTITALAFGAWKAELATVAVYGATKATADEGRLPRGRFYARSGSDFADVVIEALALARVQQGDKPALSDPPVMTVIRG